VEDLVRIQMRYHAKKKQQRLHTYRNIKDIFIDL